jgi:hypothetical protein
VSIPRLTDLASPCPTASEVVAPELPDPIASFPTSCARPAELVCPPGKAAWAAAWTLPADLRLPANLRDSIDQLDPAARARARARERRRVRRLRMEGGDAARRRRPPRRRANPQELAEVQKWIAAHPWRQEPAPSPTLARRPCAAAARPSLGVPELPAGVRSGVVLRLGEPPAELPAGVRALIARLDAAWRAGGRPVCRTAVHRPHGRARVAGRAPRRAAARRAAAKTATSPPQPPSPAPRPASPAPRPAASRGLRPNGTLGRWELIDAREAASRVDVLDTSTEPTGEAGDRRPRAAAALLEQAAVLTRVGASAEAVALVATAQGLLAVAPPTPVVRLARGSR